MISAVVILILHRDGYSVYTPGFPPPGVFGYSVTELVLGGLNDDIQISGTYLHFLLVHD